MQAASAPCAATPASVPGKGKSTVFRPKPFNGQSRISGWRRVLILGMALAIVFSTHISIPADVDAAPYTATANLNIRSGPGTSFPVVGSIPSGGAVEVTGDLQDNFYPVTHDGVSGFASVDYLTAGGGEAVEEGEDGVNPAAGPTGTRYADARLNLRSGPSTADGVIVVIPDSAAVQLTGVIANGFSQITWNGTTGWASTSFLVTEGGTSEPAPTPATTPEPVTTPDTATEPEPEAPEASSIGDTPIGTAVVSTGGLSLNMRSGPGTNFGVIRSLPNGVQVEIMGDPEGEFRPVRYQGSKGWASATYLRLGAVTTPTQTPTATATPDDEPIGDAVVGTATVTTNGLSLNMRSGPGTNFGAIRTIPSGARVDVMGAAQNGFLPVRYQGSSGWSSMDFLRVGSTGTPTAMPTTTPTPTPTATATPDGSPTGTGVVNVSRAPSSRGSARAPGRATWSRPSASGWSTLW